MGSLRRCTDAPKGYLLAKELVVYSSHGCPKCATLKKWLGSRNVEFEEKNLEDAEVMANLIMRDVFILSAPALEVGGVVYTEDEIFDEDGTVKANLLKILEGNVNERK